MTTNRIAPPALNDWTDRISSGQDELNEDIHNRDQAQRRLTELTTEQAGLADQFYQAQCTVPPTGGRVSSVLQQRELSDRIAVLQRSITQARSDLTAWNAEISEDRADVIGDLSPRIESLQRQIRHADNYREAAQAHYTGVVGTMNRAMDDAGLPRNAVHQLDSYRTTLEAARNGQRQAHAAVTETRSRLNNVTTYLPGFDENQQRLVASWFQSGIRPETSCAPGSVQERMQAQHPAEWGRFVERYNRREQLRGQLRQQELRANAADHDVSTLTAQVQAIEAQSDNLDRMTEYSNEMARRAREIAGYRAELAPLLRARTTAQATH